LVGQKWFSLPLSLYREKGGTAMTTEAYDPVEELRRLILEGRISEDALQAITGIQPEKLRFALDTAKLGMRRFTAEPLALSDEETMRLSILPGQLAEGMQIGDDERLKAILESLTIECRLTLENLARLTGLGVDDLRSTLRDPRTVAIEKKYELGIKGSYLINAINQARGR